MVVGKNDLLVIRRLNRGKRSRVRMCQLREGDRFEIEEAPGVWIVQKQPDWIAETNCWRVVAQREVS